LETVLTPFELYFYLINFSIKQTPPYSTLAGFDLTTHIAPVSVEAETIPLDHAVIGADLYFL
jgi:hypothetical protein